MKRALSVLGIVGLATAATVLLGLGQTGHGVTPPSAPPSKAVNGTATDRTLTIPRGNYTLLTFTNHTGMPITASITGTGASGSGDMSFRINAFSTIEFPLGATTSIAAGTKVKYSLPGPNVPQLATGITGWGAADGGLVAFVTDATPATPASGTAKPAR